MNLVLVAGIDIGSLTGKIVVLSMEKKGLIQKFSQIIRVGFCNEFIFSFEDQQCVGKDRFFI